MQMKQIIQEMETDGSTEKFKNYKFIIFMIFHIVWIVVSSIPLFFISVLKKTFFITEKNIAGQIVLITGSARGLGRALAFEFAKCGCKIICVDINQTLNEETVQEINETVENPYAAFAMTCDVGKLEEIKNLCNEIYKKYNRVDILVNNAGIVYGKALPNEQEDMVQKVINVNLMSCYWLVHLLLPKMKEQNRGHLVFINSISSLTPFGDAAMYTSSKYALLGLTDALLDDFSRKNYLSNIKITSVHPFFVQTEGLNALKITPKFFMINTEKAAKIIIHGVRREYIKFTVPGNEVGYWFLSLSKVIPTKIYHRLINKIYKEVIN